MTRAVGVAERRDLPREELDAQYAPQCDVAGTRAMEANVAARSVADATAYCTRAARVNIVAAAIPTIVRTWFHASHPLT